MRLVCRIWWLNSPTVRMQQVSSMTRLMERLPMPQHKLWAVQKAPSQQLCTPPTTSGTR